MATLTRDEKKLLATVQKHAASRTSIKTALVKALLGLWGGFNGWDDRDMVFGQAARSASLVDDQLLKTRRLARSYATVQLRTANAMPRREMPAVENVYPRSGTDQVQAYSRTADVYLWALKQGKTREEARALAEKRLRETAETDVMLAERDEMQKTFARGTRVLGRRRILHPELSKSGHSCGLCIVISTRIYKVKELTAVHGGCNCTDAVITEGFDPGLNINEVDLAAFYQAAGNSTFADDLRNLSVSITEHGELGPILVNDDHHHRGPDDLEDTRYHYTPFAQRDIADQRESWQKMIDRSKTSLAILELARDVDSESTVIEIRGVPHNVSDFDTAIKFHKDLIARYTARLKGL